MYLRKYNDRVIVWPVYFDISKTTSAGRRLPKKLAVESPRIEEIKELAALLGLNPQPKPDARYPRSWWQGCGYLLVDKRQSKRETLKILAAKLVELRRSGRDLREKFKS
ncbi:MAG: signal recognition particle subunit SRP19/SEC65 family protein [Candidatus Bathyarchaeia archaeon]